MILPRGSSQSSELSGQYVSQNLVGRAQAVRSTAPRDPCRGLYQPLAMTLLHLDLG